jgi:hypothetical protein
MGRSGGRARLERVSAFPLVILSRTPRWLLALLLAVILVAGLALQGIVGAVLLVLLAGFLGWLLALSWPVLSIGGRAVRAVVVIAVLAGAVWQLVGG